MTSKTKIHYLTFGIFLFIAALFISLLIQLRISGIHQIHRILYVPSFIFFPVLPLNGKSVYLYFYGVIVFSFLSFYLIHKRLGLKPSRLFIMIAGFTFFFLTAWQTVGQGAFFVDMMGIYSGKTISEKYLSSSGPMHDAYLYSMRARQGVTGKHSARLITDMDMSKDPGMFTHRALAYFLYPTFDIRNIRGHVDEPDYLLIFKKNNPFESIPDGYEALKVLGDKNLVIRKKP